MMTIEINGNKREILTLTKKAKNYNADLSVEELESKFEFYQTQKGISSQVINAIRREKPMNSQALKEELQSLATVNFKLKQIKEALLSHGIEKEEVAYESTPKIRELNEKIKNQALMITNLIAALKKEKEKAIKKISNERRCENVS
jgi:ribosome-binding ATPase YchF (GTP1/OBG family)